MVPLEEWAPLLEEVEVADGGDDDVLWGMGRRRGSGIQRESRDIMQYGGLKGFTPRESLSTMCPLQHPKIWKANSKVKARMHVCVGCGCEFRGRQQGEAAINVPRQNARQKRPVIMA